MVAVAVEPNAGPNSGGTDGGSGGGAGGWVQASGMQLQDGTYAVTVGGGGQGFNNNNNQQPGTPGSNSTFNSLVAYGGGYGASGPGNRPGGPGGSGGGAGGGGGSPGSGGSATQPGAPGQSGSTDTVMAVVLTLIRHLTQVLVAVALVVVVPQGGNSRQAPGGNGRVPVLLLVRQLLTLVAVVVVEVSHLPLEAATAVLVEEVTVGHLLPTLVTVLDRRAHLDVVAVVEVVQDLPCLRCRWSRRVGYCYC